MNNQKGPNLEMMVRDSSKSVDGLFAIRGDLDGTKNAADYSELSQFIGFVIANEEFLLPIEVMNEIIMISSLTFVPRCPKYIEGVINLRGKIIPAINIRKMIGHETISPTQSSRIIIVNFEEITTGLIVDGITYVISLNPDQIEDQAFTVKGRGAELMKGISKQGDKVNGIIDVGKVIYEVAEHNEELLEEDKDAS